ncbi:hypothetical protein [Nocardia sp. NPDC052566]|uniref:hypothetical protein n=1 Tax=Nocardia sp. NPDC052566 TaxID=3364330 RepID=UPI0037CBBF86
MSSNYQPPAEWSPPGAQFRSGSTVGRTLSSTVFALVVAPIGIGLAANGAADTREWIVLGDETARWGSTFQIIGGAVLLFLVATLAAHSPVSTVIAGLVWGLLPGLAQVFFPDDIWRTIQNTPALSNGLKLALHAWVNNGFALITGMLLLGAGIAAGLRRR